MWSSAKTMRSSIKRRKHHKQTVKVADLPEFDAAHYLDSETSIAAYLTTSWKPIMPLCWLQHWATSPRQPASRAKPPYKALRPDSAPRFDTVSPRMRGAWGPPRCSGCPSCPGRSSIRDLAEESFRVGRRFPSRHKPQGRTYTHTHADAGSTSRACRAAAD